MAAWISGEHVQLSAFWHQYQVIHNCESAILREHAHLTTVSTFCPSSDTNDALAVCCHLIGQPRCSVPIAWSQRRHKYYGRGLRR